MIKSSILVSVITPTYNRGDLLLRLYSSLRKQTSFDFEWVIVDDGSNDDTSGLVKTFSNDLFEIRYDRKENGGKHRALNRAIPMARGKYVFIVDSDDWILDTAIETICDYDLKYGNVGELCGFCFLRQYPNGETNVSFNNKDDFIASHNIRYSSNKLGDMAEVYKKQVLTDFPFPEFDGEKFLGEDVVWIEIGKKYKLVFSPTTIYVSDYLEGGLTRNRRRNNVKSPQGCYKRALVMESIRLPLKLLLITLVQAIVYGKFSKYSFAQIFKDTRYKFTTTLLYLPSVFLFRKWRKDYI